MIFNRKGLLQPPDRTLVSSKEFEAAFVDAFPSSVTRQKIFADYKNFTADFTSSVTDTFAQWVGGSFTTQKLNPRDIDVLTILDKSSFESARHLIDENFRGKSLQYPFVDSYFLPAPPTTESDFPLFRSDLLYWVHQFSYTRKDRSGKRSSRGYIEICFNNFSYHG